MEFLAALALGWVELTFLAVFFILLVVGTTIDRRGSEAPKWYIFALGAIVIVAWYWQDLNFAATLTFLTSWALWKPVVIYLCFGLLYSGLEFALTVRRAARDYTVAWKKHLADKFDYPVLNADGTPILIQKIDRYTDEPEFKIQTDKQTGETKRIPIMIPKTRSGEIGEAYRIVGEQGAASSWFNEVNDSTKRFILNHDRFWDKIIGVKLAEDKIGAEPYIDRGELAKHLGAWTFFWPAYAISLIIGDLFAEVFKAVADFFVKLSGRFVKLSFANAFRF